MWLTIVNSVVLVSCYVLWSQVASAWNSGNKKRAMTWLGILDLTVFSAISLNLVLAH